MRLASSCSLTGFAGLACLFIALSQGVVHAVVLDTHGEYHFGPETSRNQACHLAAERAKVNALSLVVGEHISSEEKLTCQQSTGRDSTASCEMNKNTWVFLDGNIRTAEKVSETVKVLDGASVCKVTMVVDIANPKTKTNAYFDVKVSLNKKNYREGEAIQIELQPSAPMYVSIFAWYPHLDGENMAQIFPNQFDTNNHITSFTRIPSHQAKQSYVLESFWQPSYPNSKEVVDEWLIVVGTLKPVAWQSNYNLKGFKEKLSEIPMNERRVVRKNYFQLR
jgi:hypothetical protein